MTNSEILDLFEQIPKSEWWNVIVQLAKEKK